MALQEETIGSWTSGELTRFIQQLIQGDETLNAPNKTIEELHVSRKLVIDDELQYTQTQTTVGAAGGATALPATPTGYIKILGADGQVRVMPYYAAS